jgi:glutathione synthase/RimK-type ligase-like ATP-grasp enzyme
VFAVKIDSQEKEQTKYDWRKDQLNVGYKTFDLPIEIKTKLLALHKEFKLVYGAYDFIVDPNGEYYFLEVNPAGQWLWMEEAIGLNISEAVAKRLLEGNNYWQKTVLKDLIAN